jgi:hypothetical protein
MRDTHRPELGDIPPRYVVRAFITFALFFLVLVGAVALVLGDFAFIPAAVGFLAVVGAVLGIRFHYARRKRIPGAD